MSEQEDRQRLTEKVRKLFDLANGTANEHEANAALKKAQELMADYGVTHDDVLAAQVKEARAPYSGTAKLSAWESRLMSAIGRAFGCDQVFHPGEGEVSFIGPDPGPELAGYAFDVLRRQCLSARRAFIGIALKRVKVRTNKVRRADLYCDGWVQTAVSKCLPVKRTEEQIAAIGAFKRAAWGTLVEVDSRDRNKDRALSDHELRDRAAGQADGRAAQLHQGVGGGAPDLRRIGGR